MATQLISWLESAINNTTDFSVYNLPYGVFTSRHNSTPHIGVAIGDTILDLYNTVQYKLLNTLSDTVQNALQQSTLNMFMDMSPDVWSNTRAAIQQLLLHNSPLASNTQLQHECTILQSDVTMHLPCTIGDYTDFYSSIYHATNVGIMFKGKDNALPANWKSLPIGYHGRASSVIPIGTNLHRPHATILLLIDVHYRQYHIIQQLYNINAYNIQSQYTIQLHTCQVTLSMILTFSIVFILHSW
jgi:fumarylacetoacetase